MREEPKVIAEPDYSDHPDAGMTGRHHDILNVRVPVERDENGRFSIPVPVALASELQDVGLVTDRLAARPTVQLSICVWEGGAIEIEVNGVI